MMPDGKGIEGLDAVRYRAMRLLLPVTPLGVEIEGLARWVEDGFAADGREPLRIVIEDGRARAEGDRDGEPFDRWRRVWRMLEGLGVTALELDARLESNQIADILTLLVSQRRCLGPRRPRSSCDTVERLKSEGGIAFSCTVTRLVGPRLEISYSYCMTRFSALVRWFKSRQTHLRDHRTLFRAAPRYAVVAGLAPMVVFLLYAAHGSWSLLLATSLLGSALLAASTYLVFMAVGSVEYDNEEQAHKLRQAYDRLKVYADRIRDDMERARTVQQRLLPDLAKMPRTDVLDWAARFEPQDDVGGDYFDAVEMADGRVAVIFADASGHGLGAALVTAILKSTFESWLERDAGVAELATMLNRRLVELTPERSFAAVVLAVVDPDARTLRYCNCGHSPWPYLIRAREGEPRVLDVGHAMILGVMPDIEFCPAEVGLEPADTVFFATDGITEAESRQGEEYGVERLEAILREHARAPLDDLVEALGEDVARFTSGREQADDRAVLAFQVRRELATGRPASAPAGGR
jgi:serine phosphatase RsbU (regulator of sigma subunit)